MLSLELLKGGNIGDYIGTTKVALKGDARSLDYGSCRAWREQTDQLCRQLVFSGCAASRASAHIHVLQGCRFALVEFNSSLNSDASLQAVEV